MRRSERGGWGVQAGAAAAVGLQLLAAALYGHDLSGSAGYADSK